MTTDPKPPGKTFAVVCPIRLSVRTDREARRIDAYAVDTRAGDGGHLLSSMALGLADADRTVFDAWVAWLTDAIRRMNREALGIDEARPMHTVHAHDLN